MEKNNEITKTERRARAARRIVTMAEEIALWATALVIVAVAALFVVLAFGSFWAAGLGYLPVIAVAVVALVLGFKALDRWSTREIEKADNQRYMEQIEEGN